jgi:hypothetical protein
MPAALFSSAIRTAVGPGAPLRLHVAGRRHKGFRPIAGVSRHLVLENGKPLSIKMEPPKEMLEAIKSLKTL